MTAVANLYRYKMFCETENKWVVTVLSSTGEPTAPTQCPNNAGHTVTANTIKQTSVVYPDQTKIDENEHNDTATSGYYYAETLPIIVGKDDAIPKTFNISFPMDISLFNTTFKSGSNHRSDRITVEINPNTPIGLVTSAVSVSDTVISVSLAMMNYLAIGFWVSLSEGATLNSLGRVIAMDWTNNQITVETAATDSFTTSVALLITVRYADVTFLDSTEYNLGKDFIGGSFIPTNYTMVISYYNNSGGDKEMSFLSQFVY